MKAVVIVMRMDGGDCDSGCDGDGGDCDSGRDGDV